MSMNNKRLRKCIETVLKIAFELRIYRATAHGVCISLRSVNTQFMGFF